MSKLLRVLDYAPRAFAALGGVLALGAGLYLSWLIVNGSGPARWVAGLGVLLLVTPVFVLLVAAVDYALANVLVLPVRSVVARRLAQATEGPNSCDPRQRRR